MLILMVIVIECLVEFLIGNNVWVILGFGKKGIRKMRKKCI